jgi:hypothetical protein
MRSFSFQATIHVAGAFLQHLPRVRRPDRALLTRYRVSSLACPRKAVDMPRWRRVACPALQ